MIRSAKTLIGALGIALGAACTSAYAVVELQFWHAMQGALGERVNALANRFNAEQKDYRVVPVFKGSYEETLAAGIAAWRAKKAPHLLQVFDGGTTAMLVSRGAIKPFYEVMKQANPAWNQAQYLPAIAASYGDRNGRMLSFPFNSSAPVLFYNKEVFAKAGITTAPKTWREVQEAAIKSKAAGSACGFTTSRQSWVQLEAMSAWHNSEFATRGNGFDGLDAHLNFNTIMLVRHIALLSSWVKGELFTYAGRRDEPEARFSSGECAMLTASSAAYASIRNNAKFEPGVARLPYYEEEPGSPYHSIIGGASVWTMAGKKPAEYKGVAAFLEFLSSPVIASQWHQQTGYLPVTNAAYLATQKGGFYERNPGADIAAQQVAALPPAKGARSIRLGNYVQIRNIIDEELELVWSGKKAPKLALDDAVKRGNEQLRLFQAAHKGGR